MAEIMTFTVSGFNLRPTRMLAVMTLTDEPGQFSRGLMPENCVRYAQ